MTYQGPTRLLTTKTDAALDLLAEMILDSEDFITATEALETLLRPADWKGLCDRVEMCPVHSVHTEICRDDRDDCEAGRS